MLLRKGHKIMIEGHYSFKNNDGGLRSLFYGCNVIIFDNGYNFLSKSDNYLPV